MGWKRREEEGSSAAKWSGREKERSVMGGKRTKLEGERRRKWVASRARLVLCSATVCERACPGCGWGESEETVEASASS
jgi:hypothetical protein